MREQDSKAHMAALDNIVAANTFFTVAILVDITGTITPSSTIPRNCVAGDDIARNFFLFQIMSFGCYLLSSLVAQAMKLAITLLPVHDADVDGDGSYDCEADTRRRKMMRLAQHVMLVAAGFTIMATLFLTLSMVFAIQLKFGLLSCCISFAVWASFFLFAPVIIGLGSYGYALIYALQHKRDWTS